MKKDDPMHKTGSYDVNKFSTTADGEIRRLNAQVDLFWDKEFQLYKKFGLANGMNILDCGSGPGYLTEKFLTLLPQCRVTAVEFDPSLVAVARKRLSEGNNGGRFSVLENSILKIDIPDCTFDFAVTRLVVEHVPDAIGACKELHRVLKPGGVVVVVDNDFEMHPKTFPPIAELNDLYAAYCKARSDEGGNPKIGRELPVLLKKAGFTKVDLEILSAHSAVVGDEAFLKSEGPGIATQLVSSGYLPAVTHQKVIAKWHDMLKNKDHAIVRQLYIATGTKGAAGSAKLAPPEHESAGKSPEIPFGAPKKAAVGIADLTTIESMMGLVSGHVATILDAKDARSLDCDAALMDLGFDSQMALDLQDALSTALGLQKSLPATLVFDYPSIRAIARFLMEVMAPPRQTAPAGPAPTQRPGDRLAPKADGVDGLSNEQIEEKLRDKLNELDRS
jgi:ubiquinone/menaquinone biosynthesis C-methylase UbiE